MFEKMKKIDRKLASESFINFVYRSNSEDVEKWQKWIKENPEYEEVVERATLVVNSLRFNTENNNVDTTSRHWRKLQDRIRKETYTNSSRPSSIRRPIYGLVAVLAGVLVSVVIWFQLWHNPTITFETDIAQKAMLKLPDGSEVTLNRNSSIRFHKSWDDDSVRQVWLEGEAHFKVNPEKMTDGKYRRFEVHTEELLIDVIGTVFSVNTTDNSYVVLESGRVDIRKKGEREVYTLKPGQSVKINTSGDLVMSETNAQPHISWIDGKILLNDNSLSEIIQFVEGSYGLTIQCDDENLLKRKLSGQIRLDNIDDLLHVLEKALDLVIVRDQDTVKILEIKKHRIHVQNQTTHVF